MCVHYFCLNVSESLQNISIKPYLEIIFSHIRLATYLHLSGTYIHQTLQASSHLHLEFGHE